MMHNMKMRNVMQEEPAHPPKEIPVNGRSCPTSKTPRAVAVMRERRVGVVEVGDHDEPVRNEEPGDAVVFEYDDGTPDETRLADGVYHRSNAKIGCKHDSALGTCEEDGVG